VETYVGYHQSTSHKDAFLCKLLIPRLSFELSHRLPMGRHILSRQGGGIHCSCASGNSWQSCTHREKRAGTEGRNED
jgi:hypothetical protein